MKFMALFDALWRLSTINVAKFENFEKMAYFKIKSCGRIIGVKIGSKHAIWSG